MSRKSPKPSCARRLVFDDESSDDETEQPEPIATVEHLLQSVSELEAGRMARKYDYDFKNDCPLNTPNADFKWETILSCDLPEYYSRSIVRRLGPSHSVNNPVLPTRKRRPDEMGRSLSAPALPCEYSTPDRKRKPPSSSQGTTNGK